MKRILALSRDIGSLQTIIPVLDQLVKLKFIHLKVSCPKGNRYLFEKGSFCIEPFDNFNTSLLPEQYFNDLISNYKPDLILTGSSPAFGTVPQTPEQFATIIAHKLGIPIVSIQDYWGMYIERFSYDSKSIDINLIPTIFCVLDKRAYSDLIKLGIPKERLVITHNPWLDLIVENSSLFSIESNLMEKDLNILLASQPISEFREERNYIYDQYDIFKALYSSLNTNTFDSKNIKLNILISAKESITQWNDLIQAYSTSSIQLMLHTIKSKELIEKCSYLVTSHSTLAYEALYYSIPCVSFRPRNSNQPSLWIEEVQLSTLCHDQNDLRVYFQRNQPLQEKKRILQLANELKENNLFFSKGNATQKVISVITKLIGYN